MRRYIGYISTETILLMTIGILVFTLAVSSLTFASGETPTPFPTDYPPAWQTEEVAAWQTKQAVVQTPSPTGTLWSFFGASTTPNSVELTPQRTPAGDGFLFGNNDQSGGRIGSVIFLSFWAVDTDDRHISVFTGAYRDDPAQGVVRVMVFTADGIQLPDGGDYPVPGHSGAVHVINAVGKRLILLSSQGQTFYFDVLGQTFTASISDIVPTATPWPITPSPSLTPTLTGDAPHNPDDVLGLSPVYTSQSFIIYHPGDEDWFRFHTDTPGTIQVHLDNLSVDYDLFVYSVTRHVYAGHDGQSTNPGTASELVTIPNAPTDDYMVRIVGVNGAFDPNHPVQLEIDVPVIPNDLQAKTALCVTDKGILNSLSAKIEHQDWNPFINEVEAQSGKKITTDCAHAMIGMATYLFNNPLPTATSTPK